MAKNPNTWRIRINPSKWAKVLLPTVLIITAKASNAHPISIAWYGLGVYSGLTSKIVLCKTAPPKYADEAVVACQPINDTHPVMKLMNLLHDLGANNATQL